MAKKQKPIWESKTIIGAVATLLIVLVPEFTTIGEAEITNLLQQIAVLATTLFTIYGRLDATKSISLTR